MLPYSQCILKILYFHCVGMARRIGRQEPLRLIQFPFDSVCWLRANDESIIIKCIHRVDYASRPAAPHDPRSFWIYICSNSEYESTLLRAYAVRRTPYVCDQINYDCYSSVYNEFLAIGGQEWMLCAQLPRILVLILSIRIRLMPCACAASSGECRWWAGLLHLSEWSYRWCGHKSSPIKLCFGSSDKSEWLNWRLMKREHLRSFGMRIERVCALRLNGHICWFISPKWSQLM